MSNGFDPGLEYLNARKMANIVMSMGNDFNSYRKMIKTQKMEDDKEYLKAIWEQEQVSLEMKRMVK